MILPLKKADNALKMDRVVGLPLTKVFDGVKATHLMRNCFVANQRCILSYKERAIYHYHVSHDTSQPHPGPLLPLCLMRR